MQRTLKRELKGPETDRKEALGVCASVTDEYSRLYWQVKGGGSFVKPFFICRLFAFLGGMILVTSANIPGESGYSFFFGTLDFFMGNIFEDKPDELGNNVPVSAFMVG